MHENRKKFQNKIFYFTPLCIILNPSLKFFLYKDHNNVVSKSNTLSLNPWRYLYTASKLILESTMQQIYLEKNETSL